MLTKQIVKTDDNINIKALILAPLCVLINHRDKGIGEYMIKESFKIAKDLGYVAVFVVGDPKYYEKFGFQKTTTFNITNINSIPDEFVMCYELKEKSLENIMGTIDVSLENLERQSD